MDGRVVDARWCPSRRRRRDVTRSPADRLIYRPGRLSVWGLSDWKQFRVRRPGVYADAVLYASRHANDLVPKMHTETDIMC